MMRDDFFLKASDTLILCVWFKFIIIDVISWEYVVYYFIRFIYPNLFGLLVDSKRGHHETAEYLNSGIVVKGVTML
jgi:hypothetical protein